MLRHMLQPGAAALQRVIAAQKLKFPELARFAYEQGWVRAVEGVADILLHLTRGGAFMCRRKTRGGDFPEPDHRANVPRRALWH